MNKYNFYSLKQWKKSFFLVCLLHNNHSKIMVCGVISHYASNYCFSDNLCIISFLQWCYNATVKWQLMGGILFWLVIWNAFCLLVLWQYRYITAVCSHFSGPGRSHMLWTSKPMRFNSSKGTTKVSNSVIK